MQKVSRRRLADYIASGMSEGSLDDSAVSSIAAYLVYTKQSNSVDLLLNDVSALLASRGTITAQVVSASPLDASSKAQIIAFLKSQTHASSVQIEESVDERLFGGVVIQTPDSEFDSSIRTQLRELKSTNLTRSK